MLDIWPWWEKMYTQGMRGKYVIRHLFHLLTTPACKEWDLQGLDVVAGAPKVVDLRRGETLEPQTHLAFRVAYAVARRQGSEMLSVAFSWLFPLHLLRDATNDGGPACSPIASETD